MKDYRGVYLLWRGELAEVISDTTDRFLGIRMVKPRKCPHCDGDLGYDTFDVIPSSPNFKQLAKPVRSLEQSHE